MSDARNLTEAARSAFPRLILASGSPRRRELLTALGASFDVVVSSVPETLDPTLPPERQAVAIASRKAAAVAATVSDGLVLGADTIVVVDNEIFGKPRDHHDAALLLRRLSGKLHLVISALALVNAASGESSTASVVSTVRFRPLRDDDIARYVASGEPLDKAGAYAIQGLGSALIADFDGCYTNIVGMPLCETARLLRQAGMTLDHGQPVCLLPDGSPCPCLV